MDDGDRAMFRALYGSMGFSVSEEQFLDTQDYEPGDIEKLTAFWDKAKAKQQELMIQIMDSHQRNQQGGIL